MVSPAEIATILALINSAWEMCKKIKGAIQCVKSKKFAQNPSLFENPDFLKEVKQISPQIAFLQHKGYFYVFNPAHMPKDAKERINETYASQKISEFNVDIQTPEFYSRVQKYNSRKEEGGLISEYLDCFDFEYSQIFKMSLYRKYLYRIGECDEAKKISEDIFLKYHEEGRKLFNLHSAGYIDTKISRLIQDYSGKPNELKKDLNKIIKDFVLHSTHIIFVHSQSDYNEIKTTIRKFLSQKRKYIAIHGAGEINVKKILKFKKSLEKEIEKVNYEFVETIKRSPSNIRFIDGIIKKKGSSFEIE